MIPRSKKYQEADVLHEQCENIKKKLETKVDDFRRKLYAENGVETIYDKYKKTREVAENETRNLHLNFLQEVYTGKYGRGELCLVKGGMHHKTKVRRILFIGKEEKQKKNFDVIMKYYGSIYWPLKPEDSNCSVNLKSPGYSWAEVGLEDVETTKTELEQFFLVLKEKSCSIGTLMEAFPKNFRPPVEEGEIFHIGGCSHHSGEIDAYGIVLPTGRLAVVTSYDGECKIGPDVEFCGVTADPKWKAFLSAKWKELRNSEELLVPTEEEIAFLKGKKIQIDHELLEDLRKEAKDD